MFTENGCSEKVLELRSYLGFRAFLVEKILIILRKLIIIYLLRKSAR